MRAPKRWRRSLATALLLAVVLPAPALAVAASTDAPASLRAGDDASSDQQAISREIQLFQGSAITLSQAMAIAEALHRGSTTADISFDGAANAPVYRVETLHNDRIWQHAIDAATGRIVGGAAALPLNQLDADDRSNLAALRAVRQRLSDAVRVAEHATSGKAISGGLVREGGRLHFTIVVISGTEMKEVILEPPGATGRK
ncbi:MAG: PepSY domain-containing protein [Bradyrhizobium guangdongense]